MERFVQEVRGFLEDILGKAGVDIRTLRLDAGSVPWYFLGVLERITGFESRIEGDVHHTFVVNDNPIYLGNGSVIKPYTVIEGPLIVGENTVIGPHAYFRGTNVIGSRCKVGRAEVKNSIVMDESKVPHESYVGDSVLGKSVNIGAGTRLANSRVDKKTVAVRYGGQDFETGRRKVGSFMEDNSQTGCNVVLNPGTYVESGFIYVLEKARLIRRPIRRE